LVSDGGLFVSYFIIREVLILMYESMETVDELSERWKVPKSWLYSRTRETCDGCIPRVKIGKYLRFIPQEVDDWLRRQQAAE
jgi:hypothetical protein